MITKSECKKKINDLLTSKSKKYKKIPKYLYFELYLQIYFLLDGKRKIAQIADMREVIQKFEKIVKKEYPYYKVFEENRLILYHPNYDITQINQTFSTKHAKDLGEFYICAGNLDKIYNKHKFLLQPSIEAVYYTEYGEEIRTPIFIQMCPPNICLKNIKTFYKIRQEFDNCISKINPKIRVDFMIYTYLQR